MLVLLLNLGLLRQHGVSMLVEPLVEVPLLFFYIVEQIELVIMQHLEKFFLVIQECFESLKTSRVQTFI